MAKILTRWIKWTCTDNYGRKIGKVYEIDDDDIATLTFTEIDLTPPKMKARRERKTCYSFNRHKIY